MIPKQEINSMFRSTWAFAIAAASFSCVPAALADFVSSSRNSSISVGLITVGPPVAPATSTLVDSAADLALSGSAAYADGFGRDFFGTYDSAQDVGFRDRKISGRLTQTSNTILNSEGFPGSRVFSIDIINRYESAFTVTEDTTLRLTLNFTGTVTLSSAPDSVDFRINTQFGGLFVMPLIVPAGNYVNETLTFDIQFLANTEYYIVAETRAFSGSGEGTTSSDLGFTLAAVPAPSSFALLMLGGSATVTRRRR